MRTGVMGLVLVACTPAAPLAPKATVTFVAPPGEVRGWSFDVRGLPAIDTRTGEILVADAPSDRLASWERVALLSLRAGVAARTMTLLVDGDALGDLRMMEGDEVPATNALAARARANTRAANVELGRRALRPLEPCRLPPDEPMIFCTHPQKLTCGPKIIELDDRQMPPGWQIPPMDLGDGGPPKQMLACIEEADLDRMTMQLVIRFHRVCAGGGSDACILDDEWRVLPMK